MRFTSASAVEQVVHQMRLADFPRGINRAALNSLYNGTPPFTEQEVLQNNVNTNVNFLEGTKILHDARGQFSRAFSSGPQLFTVNTDYGEPWKRRKWSTTITNEINKLITRSRKYLDCRDSVFALDVLHGIGPSIWEDREMWCPKPYGIEDVLVPSNTLTSLENLPFFGLYRQYTPFELWKKTHGANVDPAWNMELVDQVIAWADQEARTLMSSSWPETWSPEKMAERIKQDGGLYSSDAVPTIDTYDLYYWDDSRGRTGWRRRIVMDAWGSPGYGGAGGIIRDAPAKTPTRLKRDYLKSSNFLYDSKDRVVASKIDEIIHFQFADCSCVAPFRYHSVRSLGFLLYAVCHLQNRLRCKFNDAVFESLLQYFRVGNPQDMERLSKIDLIDKGVIPEGATMMGPNERWQYDEKLAQMGLQLNRESMSENSSSFVQDIELGQDSSQETATRTMAKVNATNALVGAMLNKAYNQQEFQYAEIARRFTIRNSKDADVRKFRVNCLRAGVPEKALNFECWEVKPVRVIGSGNKTLQIAMADKLMAVRALLDPNGQKLVERIYVLANSDDPSLVDQLVPESRKISDSVHDAQAVLGTILKGLPVSIEEGMNHEEYVEVWLHALGMLIKQTEAAGGTATPEQIMGFQNLAQHIQQHIAKLGQDPEAKSKVKLYSDDLGQLSNLIKGYVQRSQEQQAKGNGKEVDPEVRGKIQSNIILAQSKAKIAADNHALKTGQKRIQFQEKMKQDAEQHRADLAAKDLEVASTVRRGNLKSFEE